MVRNTPEYSQKRSGAYFTPADVAASLVAWACRKPGDRMLDPSCGDGEFLIHHPNSVGIEQNPLSAHRAIARVPGALVHEGDFFAWACDTSERFEAAAGNPPFIRYQTFKGDMRRRALALCQQLGASFSGLASSWAPFLVATAGLLKRGGRMAFVVPAEIGHAPYAAPLLEYLVSSFSTVKVVAVREKLFPGLSEDCWLLFVDGHGGKTDVIEFTALDRFVGAAEPPPADIRIDVGEWRQVWNCRLRPFLLPASVRAQYAEAAASGESRRLSDFAQVGIGYVSGDNDFFHLRPSEAKRWKIPAALLQPSLRNGRAMPAGPITSDTVTAWKKRDDKVLLLRLRRGDDIPLAVTLYLDSSAGREARQGYKCRNRTPWYAVPDVHKPEYFMSYMSGRAANLVRNSAAVTCTNSVHGVRVRDAGLAAKFLPRWSSPFVRLSCEIEGHALGGGMLKLEPREAGRILFPDLALVGARDDELNEAVTRLQRWRHYAD
ncbi:N-6 DNA methylase [Sphingopyxis fribergensis]